MGAILVSPPLLISILGLRSIFQQTLNQAEYIHFKKRLHELLVKNKDLNEILKTFLNHEEPSFTNRKMKESFLIDSDPILGHDFESTSDQSFDEFIKNQIKNELGLVENPTDKELQDIIQGSLNRNPRRKGKTVFFQDFIEEMEDSVADFSEADVFDAEMIEPEMIEPIKSEKVK